MTQALENYVDLHRHLAVRQALIAHPHTAFRLAVAHMAAASGNWSVKRDPQTTRNPAIRASIEVSAAQAAFAIEEQAVFALLGWAPEGEDQTFVRLETADIFVHLLTLADADVLRIATFFMARSLQAGSDVVEEVGTRLSVDARAHWQPDDAFFDLIHDRATVNALLAELAGEAVAKANIAEKAKIQKQIVRDCLAGANGRPKVEGWLPGWLEFPARGIGQIQASNTKPCNEIEPERMAAE
jgi:ParB family chromosome partitioning protein